MEDKRDVRYKAQVIAEDARYGHVDLHDAKWAVQTIEDLLDEMEGRP